MPLKPLLTFNRFVLVGGLIAAMCVACGPLFMDVWARYAWTQVPCYIYPVKQQPGESPREQAIIPFVFEHNGKRWVSKRDNMWYQPNRDTVELGVDMRVDDNNGTCWINGGNPPAAVRNLNTWQHLGDGLGNYVGGALILVVTLLFLIFGRTKRPSPAHPVS